MPSKWKWQWLISYVTVHISGFDTSQAGPAWTVWPQGGEAHQPPLSVFILRFGCKEHVLSLIQNSEPFLHLSQSLANQMCQRLYAINLCCVSACPYNYRYLCSLFPPLCLSYVSLLCQPDNPDSQVTNRNHIAPRSFPSFLLWAPYTLHTTGPLDSCFMRCFAHAASLSVFVLQPLLL